VSHIRGSYPVTGWPTSAHGEHGWQDHGSERTAQGEVTYLLGGEDGARRRSPRPRFRRARSPTSQGELPEGALDDHGPMWPYLSPRC
jgi:hypothetical protein